LTGGKCKDLKGFRLENVKNLDLMMGVLYAKSLGNVFRMLPGLEIFNYRSAFEARERGPHTIYCAGSDKEDLGHEAGWWAKEVDESAF
jgi:hypothetical protein